MARPLKRANRVEEQEEPANSINPSETTACYELFVLLTIFKLFRYLQILFDFVLLRDAAAIILCGAHFESSARPGRGR